MPTICFGSARKSGNVVIPWAAMRFLHFPLLTRSGIDRFAAGFVPFSRFTRGQKGGGLRASWEQLGSNLGAIWDRAEQKYPALTTYNANAHAHAVHGAGMPMCNAGVLVSANASACRCKHRAVAVAVALALLPLALALLVPHWHWHYLPCPARTTS